MNNLDTSKLLAQIIIALLPILTAFIVRYLNIKSVQLKDITKNKQLDNYINLAIATIQDIVIATNQTTVDNLKKQGQFTQEAQKQVFKDVKEKVLKILPETAKKAILLLYGDINSFLDTQIEVAVNQNKPANKDKSKVI